MSDDLNGKTLLIGAASPPLLATFTRAENDSTTDYEDADIQLRIFSQDKKGKPDSDTEDLTLSVGSGLTRATNTATVTAVTAQITTTQLSTLLGAAEAARYGYVWAIRPVGATDYIRAFLAEDYDGYFVVAKQGYGGAESVKVP